MSDGWAAFLCLILNFQRFYKMPKTKLENAFFTLITSGFMIFIMGVYNTAVHTGGLKYSTFVYAL